MGERWLLRIPVVLSHCPHRRGLGHGGQRRVMASAQVLMCAAAWRLHAAHGTCNTSAPATAALPHLWQALVEGQQLLRLCQRGGHRLLAQHMLACNCQRLVSTDLVWVKVGNASNATQAC